MFAVELDSFVTGLVVLSDASPSVNEDGLGCDSKPAFPVGVIGYIQLSGDGNAALSEQAIHIHASRVAE